MRRPQRINTLVTILLSAVLSAAAPAQGVSRYQFNIESRNAVQALRELADVTGKQLLFPYELVEARESTSVSGRYTLEEALEIMLIDTFLSGELTEEGVILITPVEKKSENEGRPMINKQTTKSLFTGIAAFFAAALSTANVTGQEAETQTASGGVLEEIIVTAQKREQSIQDVPISIMALSGEQLDMRGITDLQSLSLAVPGLLVSETGSLSRFISIRGIGNVSGNSSLVGLYLDEASVVAFPRGQVDLRVHDLARVEVLKGPQGTLYGEGSVGGTIRYITNDPQLDGFAGELSLDGAFTEGGDPSQEMKGVLNIPLADTLGLRLVGQYINSGGWIDQPALDKSDINDYELFNVRAKLLWVPTDNLEIKTTAIVHRNDVGAQNTGEDDEGNYTQALLDPTTPSGEDNYDLYSLQVSYDFGDLNLVSATSYLDIGRQFDNVGDECCFLTGNPDNPDELLNLLRRELRYSAEVFTQELRLSAQSSDAFFWSAGFYYRDGKMLPFDSTGFLAGAPGPGGFVLDFGNPFQEENSQSWAVFGEASYALNEQWELGAGLRYYEDDREFRGSRTGPFSEDTFDSLNPKLFVKYAVNEQVNLYANVAKGYRSGGFNGAGPVYEPEEVLSYEIGAKMASSDGRLTAEFALFFSDYEDYQIVGVVPSSGLTVTSNAGEAEVLGSELLLQWQATEQLQLGFSGNYMDTELVTITSGNSSHAVGDPLDLVPQYGYSLWSDYRFDWFDGSAGFFRLDYSEQGKSNYRNRSSDFAPNYHSQSDVIHMLNSRLGWERGAWQLEFYALNLFDEDGFIGPLAIEKGSSRPRPRTVGINLGFTF